MLGCARPYIIVIWTIYEGMGGKAALSLYCPTVVRTSLKGILLIGFMQ